jgi:hypothetical protein
LHSIGKLVRKTIFTGRGARVLPLASHAAALQQFGEVCNFVNHACTSSKVILVLTAVENEKIGLCTNLFYWILVLTRNLWTVEFPVP